MKCVLLNGTVTIKSPSDSSIAEVVFFNNTEQHKCPFSELFNRKCNITDVTYVNKTVQFSNVTEDRFVYIVNSKHTRLPFSDSCESVHFKYEFIVESGKLAI